MGTRTASKIRPGARRRPGRIPKRIGTMRETCGWIRASIATLSGCEGSLTCRR
jgi:hypothetical protein